MSVPDTLNKARDIFEERTKVYGGDDAYIQFGTILKALFPQGMRLESESDFARAANIIIIIRKLSRYTWNFEKGGHEDSVDDSIVYWALQKELDAQIIKTKCETTQLYDCECASCVRKRSTKTGPFTTGAM